MSERTPSAAPIIGSSTPLRRALALAGKVAPSSLSVLIQGESGTGKELLARHIHDRSARAAGPFVAVNCAAIPRDLLESVLFGHERGAFTGAVTAKVGAFQSADGGTLFLDEIGDMAPEHQAKVLRALQEGEVQSVGASKAHRVDVRVVAATHRDLVAEARASRFREDLYFRLAAFTIRLPPLRERGRDVVRIASAVLRREHPDKVLSRAVEVALLRYAWPGNIRELENVIRGAAVLATGKRITEATLPPALREQHQAPPRFAVDQVAALDDLLHRARFSPAEARVRLGVGRTKAFEVLRDLESRRVIERRGKGRATYYIAVGDDAHRAAQSEM